MRGRPLAFMALVVTVWSGGRFWSLLPDEIVRPLTLASEASVIPAAAAEELTVPIATAAPRYGRASEPVMLVSTAAPRTIGRRVSNERLASVVVAAAGAPVAPAHAMAASAVPDEAAPPGLPPALPTTDRRSRWSGSAWAIVRDGGGGSLLSPLLGGSQAGVRVAYRLDDDGRTALFARAAAPLKNGPAELAAGAQWRPTKAAVTIYAEVREARGQAAPAAGLFSGGAVALPASFRLEGYGQAGLIERDGVSGFGDGQIRLVRPIGRVEVGAGTWVAVQRGASRLDVGPSLAVPIPVDPLALRLTLDWRHRIAGNARPASGPIVSLGADF